MFRLRVHSVDKDAMEGSSRDVVSPKIQETRGNIHLYRNIFRHPPLDSFPAERSTLLFVLAVPTHMSCDDFLRFCDSFLYDVMEIRIIRNDGMDDRYSVLIKILDQKSSDVFYQNLNGRRFSSTEAEICHILFTESIEYTELMEIANTPPVGYAELPTCPVCLERLDQDTSGIMTAPCDHSFQCSCTSKWTNSTCPVCRICQRQSGKSTCSVCETLEDLWICLLCGFVGCGRYKEGHAIMHWKDTQHRYSLHLETQRVWDYVGDSYVHRLNQSKADGKSGSTITRCRLDNNDCGSCDCCDDSGYGRVLFESKAEAIVDEYNHLLASQLEEQRQYYESLIAEAKESADKIISEAVEEAGTSVMQNLQLEIDKCNQETKLLAELNDNLMKEQNLWRERMKEVEERENLSVKLMEEKIVDFQEQIRDLTIFLEAKNKINEMTDADDLKGGTLLAVPSKSSSPSTKTKRTPKNNRRRH